MKIKICGITQNKQAIAISQQNIHALGFILHPSSPRYVPPEKVPFLIKGTSPFVKKVGVVVNQSIEKIQYMINITGLDVIQLHGEESPEFCKELTKQNIQWIKAFRVHPEFDFSILDPYPTSFFLLDAFSDKEYGGTGKTLDWEMLKSICKKHQIILAGGLTPENVKHAIVTCKPHAIDISSGVEITAGNKDIQKIQEVLININNKIC